MRGRVERQKLRKLKKLRKVQFQKFKWFFLVFQCSVQSEVEKLIVVKSSLSEVRFNPSEMRLMSHQSDCQLFDANWFGLNFLTLFICNSPWKSIQAIHINL